MAEGYVAPIEREYLKVAKQCLEAAGYTVTPPDPLAADREFLAGLMDLFGMKGTGSNIRDGGFLRDPDVAAAMEYLRKNKERL